MSVAAFALEIGPRNSEIFNGKRLSIGFSELAGVLEHMNHLVKDGVAREFWHS